MEDADQPARLRQMAQSLVALTGSGRSVRRHYGATPAPGSQAEAELAEWAASPYDDRLLVEAVDAGLKSLVAAEDFLTRAGNGYEQPESAFSSTGLIRSSLEAA